MPMLYELQLLTLEMKNMRLRDKKLRVAERELLNLLAIIHGDGGHHTEEVGIVQSVKDAHQTWGQLMLQVEELEGVLAELLEVARLRGDNSLPHPDQDPKSWSARMQTAWDEAERLMDGRG